MIPAARPPLASQQLTLASNAMDHCIEGLRILAGRINQEATGITLYSGAKLTMGQFILKEAAQLQDKIVHIETKNPAVKFIGKVSSVDARGLSFNNLATGSSRLEPLGNIAKVAALDNTEKASLAMFRLNPNSRAFNPGQDFIINNNRANSHLRPDQYRVFSYSEKPFPSISETATIQLSKEAIADNSVSFSDTMAGSALAKYKTGQFILLAA